MLCLWLGNELARPEGLVNDGLAGMRQVNCEATTQFSVHYLNLRVKSYTNWSRSARILARCWRT
jgi:hypothetical protein